MISCKAKQKKTSMIAIAGRLLVFSSLTFKDINSPFPNFQFRFLNLGRNLCLKCAYWLSLQRTASSDQNIKVGNERATDIKRRRQWPLQSR